MVPRRSLLTLIVLVSLVLVAVLVPRTPAGRGWLLEQARGAAARAGWTVDWRDSAGDPWSSVELRGVRIEGPGVDATLGRAQVAWFAPALLTGDLPLWITIENADIGVDGEKLRGLGGDDADAGGLPVRPDLRELSLTGVRVRIGDAPYTLPDLRLEDLAVDGSGSSLGATGRLASDDGSLTFAADIGLSPFSLEAEVHDADLRMARAWWTGVTGGQAQGTVAFRPGQGLTGQLDVREGSLLAARVDVDQIDGPVVLDAGLISAELTGRALSGPVAATARVDVPNRRWSGSVRATPDVDAAARWGTGGALPAALTPEGTALVTASVSGWTRVQLDGTVRAEGTLNQRPFGLASDDVTFRSGEGLAFSAEGSALGGALRVDTAVRDEALSWDVALDGGRIGPATDLSGRLELRTAERLTGTFDVTTRIAAPESLGRLQLDGQIDGGTIHAFVEGTEIGVAQVDGTQVDGTQVGGAPVDGTRGTGGRLEGAVTVAGGSVQGAVRLRDAGPLAGEPVELELRVDGPLTDLPFALELRGDAPWRPDLPGVTTDADLRGTVTGRYAGLTLTGLDGTLGPIGVAGSLALTPDADPTAQPLRWSLSPTTVGAGPARGVVEVVDGQLAPWRPAGSTLTGQLAVTDVAAEPARIDAAQGALTVQLPWLATDGPRNGVAVRLDGDSLDVTYLNGRVELLARGVPLTVADASGPLQADLALDPAEPLASLRGTASFAPTDETAGALPSLALDASETGLRLDATLPAGTALAGSSLAQDLQLQASLDATGTGEIAAWAGDVVLRGTLTRTDLAGDDRSAAPAGLAFDGALASGATVAVDGPTLRAEPGEDPMTQVRSPALSLRTSYPSASLATIRLTRTPPPPEYQDQDQEASTDGASEDAALAAELDGAVDLGSVAALLGVDVAGTFFAEAVRLTSDGASGSARATLTGPVETRLDWEAGTLTGSVPTPLGDVDVAGTLRPGAPVTATARHDWGQASWRDGALSGGGTVPGRAWRGVRLDEVPWSLEPTSLDAIATASASGAGDGAGVRIGIADGQATWSDGRVQARLDLPGSVADTPVRLEGDVSYAPGGASPSFDLAVAPVGGGPSLLRAAGTFDALRLDLAAPAATVASAAQLGIEAGGRIEVGGRVDVTTGRLDASGDWRAGDASLSIDVDRSDDAMRITVASDALDAEVGPEGASVRADDARLGAFLPALERLVLDGALSVRPAEDDGPAQAAPLPTLDTLIHGAWQGQARIDVAQLGSVVLTGRDGSLDAAARWSGAGATAEIAGTITPALDLAVTATHPPSGATLDARIAGPIEMSDEAVPVALAAIELSGALMIPGLATEAYGLAATQLTLAGSASAPRLVGPTGESVRLSSGRLSGSLTLDARIAGQSHAVEVGLDGPWSAPRADARLRGPHAQLDATLDADPAAEGEVVTLSGSVGEGAWPLAAAPAAPGRATVRGGVTRDGRWTARIEADAAPTGRPLELALDADGHGLEGAADWRVAAPDGAPLLSGRARLEEGLATVSTDLSTLDVVALGRWTGIEASADASGVVSASWRPSAVPSLEWQADVQIDGRLEEREVALTASLSDAARTSVDAAPGAPSVAETRGSVRLRVGDEEITAERAPGADAWTVQAAGVAYALSGQLAADATSAELQGTLDGTPLELRVAREAGGSLLGVASWSGAQASLGVRPEREGWRVTLDVAVPARAGLPAAGTFSARGTFEGGDATVERADLVLLEPTDLRADLSGRIWPTLGLRGAVTGLAQLASTTDAPVEAASLADGPLEDGPLEDGPGSGATDAVALTASGSWDAATVRATTPGLSLGAELDGVDLVRLELRGEGRELAGVRIVPGPDGLSWGPADGWAGSAVARWSLAADLDANDPTGSEPPVSDPPVSDPTPGDAATTLTATLDGRGDALGLVLAGEARTSAASGRLDAEARLIGPPWNATLDGSGRFRADARAPGATSESPAASPAASLADVDVTFELTGSPLAPRLDGVVTLSGATEASGTVGADLAGARLTVSGPHLDLDATVDAAGWRAQATSDALDLSAWIPAVREPRLDARATVDAAWGARPTGRVSAWTLRANGGEVSGSAQLSDDWSVTAEIDADLGEALAGGASGRVTGPLSVRAAPGVPPLRARLTGALRAQEVRVGDVTVDGTVGLNGTLPVPEVRADLRLGGPVEGTLQLGWRPDDRRLDLTSDLEVRTEQGAWSSDLRVAGSPGTLIASGGIVAPRGTLAASSDGTDVMLDGQEALTGVALVLRPFAASGLGANAGAATGADTSAATGADTGAGDDADAAADTGAQAPRSQDAPDAQPAALIRWPLSTVSGALAGEARLALSLDAERWLDGTVIGAAVSGVPLPDLRVAAEGSVVTVDSDERPQRDDALGAIEARLDLLDRGWSAAARDLELPGAGRLDLTASGTGAQGAATAELTGPGGGTVLATASQGPGVVRLTAAGTVLDATVEVDVRRDHGAWSGRVEARSLPTPAGALSVGGTVHGEAALPDAELDVQLDGPVTVGGSATIASATIGGPAGGGATGPSLDVALEAQLPGAAAVTVTGRAWPRLDLRIAGRVPTVDAGASDAETARLTAPSWSGDRPWQLTGATDVSVPGVTVRLEGAGGAPILRLVPTALPGATRDDALVATLPAAAPLSALATIGRDGLTAEGEGRLAGTVAWRPALNADLSELTYAAAAGVLVLDGTVRDGVADLTGRFRPAPGSGLPADLIGGSLGRSLNGEGLALSLRGGVNDATLRVDDASDAPDPLAVQARWSGDDRTARLTLTGGGATADLTVAPGAGLTGRADLRALALRLPGGLDATLRGDLVATGAAVEGRLELSGPGRATLDGRIALPDVLPTAYRATGPGGPVDAAARGTEASIRISELEVSALPGASRLAPRATGGINAVIELRGSRVLAQLAAPDLRTGGRAVPLRLEGAGDLGARGDGVGFSGAWAGSPVQGTADLERLQLLWTLERFPIQAPIEARVGSLDVDAEATGVLRLELPWRAPGSGSVRIATERVRLERSGIVTTGTIAADAQAGRLTVDAAFEGVGRWEAQGTIAQDELAFVLRADQADATPLLGLVPSLARLNVEALGDLTLEAHGTVASPRITARTQDLELALAGARYRLSETDVALEGPDLSVSALISGVQPVGGQLRVAGDGRLRLDPWRLEDAGVSVDGDLNVPLVGELSDLTGDVRADAEGRPYLDVTGRLGAPLRVEGTLWPLDLRASGEMLSLRAPALLLADSTSDLDLRLRYDELFHLSGRVEAREGRFVLGIRPPAAAPPQDGTGRRSALSRFVFDDLAFVGRQLSFSENFGSALFDADLGLTGTAAGPRLSGRATAQRGTFRFSGRDFSIARGVARFEPSRGAFPVLEVEAVATFDKRDVLASAVSGVTFEQPSGATFEVRLEFEAEVLPTPGEPRPFRLDLDPVLTSNAVVSIPAGEGLSAGARTLSEAELLSLVALGRLDLSGELAGGGVAGGVARSALDNAVDLLILAELQTALSEALGIDVVEIRTSTLSSVLAGDDDPFGVSLRLGGYVGEGLFASYEVGRFADADGDDALSNTLALTYELGPIAFDLSTRIDFADVAAVQPAPEMTAGLRYQLTPFLAIEGGASVSTPESEARFGVTLRW